jgi:hypothetical protein
MLGSNRGKQLAGQVGDAVKSAGVLIYAVVLLAVAALGVALIALSRTAHAS